jgi:hypothetical protein
MYCSHRTFFHPTFPVSSMVGDAVAWMIYVTQQLARCHIGDVFSVVVARLRQHAFPITDHIALLCAPLGILEILTDRVLPHTCIIWARPFLYEL